MKVKGEGKVKVALLSFAETGVVSTDWGDEEQVLSSGWTTLRLIRTSVDSSSVQLRVEVQGSSLEITEVCVESGVVPEWPFFDGSTDYGLAGDHVWQGYQGGSYSLWYNNRRSLFGLMFDQEDIREVPPTPGLENVWGDKSDPNIGVPTYWVTFADPGTNYWEPWSSVLTITGKSFPQLIPPRKDLLPDRYDLITIDTSANERMSGFVYRWTPAGTKVIPHYDVLYPYDTQDPIPDIQDSPVLPYESVAGASDGVVYPW